MRLIDSHAHLTDARFQDDLVDVLDRARMAGVEKIISVASDVADSERAIALAVAHPSLIRATVGIHPHEAGAADVGDLDRVRTLAESSEEVVAIGETGLDYHYDHSPRSVQRRLFLGHIEIARELGRPLVVHSRAALSDTMAIIREQGRDITGVLHCFTGEPELLEAALEAGWWVSYTGVVTFRNWGGMAAVRSTPADRFMVETDAPWLSPVPERGQRNEPARVAWIVRSLADARGVTAEEVAEQSTANATRFFGLD